MVIHNKEDALKLISEGELEFSFPIDPFLFTKFQLYLTGKATKGVELFGVGPQEIRGMGFMVEFHELINNAVHKHYRVFVVKRGSYFGSGIWQLEFKRNLESSR